MHQPSTAANTTNRRDVLRATLALVALTAAATCCVNPLAAQAKDKAFPEFSVVEKVAKAYFAGLSGYKPGDILTRRDVKPLFAKLEKKGWKVADQSAILDRLLADRDFLVRELRSRAGKPFMRQVGRLPGGYDRVDRLRKMPYGQRRIRELVRGPDGYKLIEYMTTAKGGRNLGRQLSRGRNGQGFNKPTGRLYTSQDVLAQLKQSYQTERKRRDGKQQRK